MLITKNENRTLVNSREYHNERTQRNNKNLEDEIGIFGSYSRGEHTRKSDIDLLVSLKKPLGLEFVDLCYELEELLNHKVDLVSKGALKKRMFDYIKETIVYV